MNARASVKFRGKVQGVFFRANTQETAIRFGVFGWVKNLHDGSVGAVFEGEKDDIEGLIEWCKLRQPYAHVESADVKWEDYRGEFTRFEVRY